MLTGFRHSGHKWWAIGLSAIAFGMVHFFLQQKVSATFLGLLIGFLAVQTGSLVPCMVFHAIYNGLALTAEKFVSGIRGNGIDESSWSLLLRSDEASMFQPGVLVVCLVGVVGLCYWLQRIVYRRTEEEALQEIRDRQLVGA